MASEGRCVRGLFSATRLLLAGIVLAAAVVALLSGRANSNETRATVREVIVRSRESQFEPDRLRVRAGAIRVTLDNTDGEMLHDLTIDSIGNPGMFARLLGPPVRVVSPPGGRAALEFTAAEGAYLFYCSIYWHRLDGITGVLVVDESSGSATPPGR